MGCAGVRAGAGRPGTIIPAAPAGDAPSTLTSAGSCPCAPVTRKCRRLRACRRPAPAPVIYQFVLCFPKQGNASLIDAQTYLYYMPQSVDLVSLPSQNVWKPYNEAAEQIIIGDHKRLWATNFLDDLKIEVVDFPFSNGVIGKVIVYEMEERQRIKNTVYNEGTKAIEQAKVEERLRELGITIRLDSFVDQATEKKVANVIREMMVEKGFQEAKVEPYHEALPGGPKTIALKFKITEGPKIKISNVDFVGNTVFSDGKIRGKMKTNKGGGFWIFPGSSVYQEDKFEEDAEMVVAFYRDRGYLQINVGQPNLKPIRDSKDGKQRFMTLEIPISEGERYRVDKFEFAGNDKVPADIMRPFFKMKTGDYYNEKRIREGFQKIQEIYGAGGHFEMTPYPEFVPEGDKVNVTIRINEGKQYFINRITFQGNTTTRDSVIRRELRLYENSVYNTEALKYSVKRLNQLGYFKPLEDQKNITTEKTPGADNKVDVDAEARRAEPQPALLRRGRVAVRRHIRPAVIFDRQLHGARRDVHRLDADRRARQRLPGRVHRAVPVRSAHHRVRRSAQARHRVPVSVHAGIHRRQPHDGLPAGELLAGVLQLQLRPRVCERPEPGVLRPGLSLHDGRMPDDRLRQAHRRTAPDYRVQPVPEGRAAHRAGRRRTISKFTPTFSLNSIDNPITPTSGRRYTASLGLRRPRRQHEVHQSDARRHLVPAAHVEDLPRSARPAGIHPSVRPTSPLPIFERLVLGGGYSIRGYDLRSVGPKDPHSSIVIGGNKSLLFNAEYLISVGGPVRLILFYDAGQVQNDGEPFRIGGHFEGGLDGLYVPGFITSTGAEIRFFMPVLNVPFRLIFASNPQRKGVLNYSTGQPEKAFRFRFDVGSTF